MHDFSAYESVQYRLNFKTAGTAFGSQVNQVKSYMMTLTDEEKEQLQQNGEVPIVVEEQQLTLLSSHVIAEAIVKDDYILAEDSKCRVLMNVQLTESLLQEGQIRELIRFIQDSRKSGSCLLNNIYPSPFAVVKRYFPSFNSMKRYYKPMY